MLTTQSLKRQIDSTEGLQSVVKTMKVLSAVSIRQYEEAVRSLEQYYATVERGLQVVLRSEGHVPPDVPSGDKDGLCLVVFGSGQGLCGRFNEEIAAFAMEDAARRIRPEPRTTLAYGEHVAAQLQNQGVFVDRTYPVPSSIRNITSSVQGLVVDIDALGTGRSIGHLVLYHNRPGAGIAYGPSRRQLLPLDPAWLERLRTQTWPTRTRPTFRMERSRLLAALIRHYVFVSIYRSLAESLAAEHASRLAAMQTAEKNIEERLDELNAQYRSMRQTLITEEVLEVMMGFEALRTGASGRGRSQIP